MSLLIELDRQPICADGAMGTLLRSRQAAASLEGLCLDQPDVVTRIHQEYLAAGARIIRTNSFQANSRQLARHGLAEHVNEINWQAAQLARQAARGVNAWVAGSVGPIAEADLPEKEREDVYRTQIGALLDGGAQLIVLETFQKVDDLLLALQVKYSLHHCPAICLVAPGADGKLANGMELTEAFRILARNDADIVGINCVDPRQALALLGKTELPDLPIAALPSAGRPGADGNYPVTETQFAEAGAALVDAGVRIVGGCCGTTPSFIAALQKRLLRETEEGQGPDGPKD